MRQHSLLLTAPKVLRWDAQTLRKPVANEVLVRTLHGAVSVGTEVPLYAGTSRGGVTEYPKMTGYESYGVVEACGPAVRELKLGDRVVSFYGHRTHANESESRFIHVPEGLEPTLALLAVLSCDVKKGIAKVAPGRGERVLVTGAGAIGFLTLFVLKALGVEVVDVVERVPERLELGRTLGATNAWTPEEAENVAASYAVGVECSSRDAAFALLQAKLLPNGRLCVLADGNVEPLTLTPEFHSKELRVVGSSDGLNYKAHAEWFYALPDLPKLDALYDLRVSATNLPKTFEEMARGKVRPVKVLVTYEDAF